MEINELMKRRFEIKQEMELLKKRTEAFAAEVKEIEAQLQAHLADKEPGYSEVTPHGKLAVKLGQKKMLHLPAGLSDAAAAKLIAQDALLKMRFIKDKPEIDRDAVNKYFGEANEYAKELQDKLLALGFSYDFDVKRTIE